ncbi:hypothetical protein UFOVP787_168 [uncultured Caudovirales phage]|uniref:Uncharacterized protein n=1 Tax=uncultured Caudovirales phage TaxID=2100421 RepID=A0A6J5P5U6_9CAUD|nr:hypothetical protein UFOVP787_168 [uncultured Caudovirales phage]
MILESAQLLSTAHRVLDGQEVEGLKVNLDTGKVRKTKAWQLSDSRDSVIYSATHRNHPSAIWCRNSVENYNWLVDHFYSLMSEYTYRYEKTHKCFGEISYMLQSPPKKLEKYDWTEMPSCMDNKYIISEDPIVNYRNYYKVGKTHLHKWTRRDPPEWIF